MAAAVIAFITDRAGFFDELIRFVSRSSLDVAFRIQKQSEFQQDPRKEETDVLLVDIDITEDAGLTRLQELKKIMPSHGEIFCLTGKGLTDADRRRGEKKGALCVMSLKTGKDPAEKALQLCIERVILQKENLSLKKNLRLFERIRRIALIMDLDKLINKILDTAIELCRANCGAVFFWRQDLKGFVVHTFRDINEDFLKTGIFGLNRDYLNEIIDQGEAVLLDELQTLPAFTQNIPPEKRIQSMMISPIITRGFKLGGIVLGRYEREADSFSFVNLNQIKELIEWVAEAVQNALLHDETEKLTIKDDLTVAYNRRYFDKFIHEELIRCQRYGSPLSLIFMDLDDLKQVNTEHGHYMGSKVLREVAHRLITSVRNIDKVFRYGGDEFCVVLPETDSTGAFHVAERIRKRINGEKFQLTSDEKMTLTGSFGIASYPLHASTKEELLNFADRAVFQVKASTKDSVLIAKTETEEF